MFLSKLDLIHFCKYTGNIFKHSFNQMMFSPFVSAPSKYTDRRTDRQKCIDHSILYPPLTHSSANKSTAKKLFLLINNLLKYKQNTKLNGKVFSKRFFSHRFSQFSVAFLRFSAFLLIVSCIEGFVDVYSLM